MKIRQSFVSNSSSSSFILQVTKDAIDFFILFSDILESQYNEHFVINSLSKTKLEVCGQTEGSGTHAIFWLLDKKPNWITYCYISSDCSGITEYGKKQ